MLLLLLLVIGMVIILIVKPKRTRAPVDTTPPASGSDPIGLGTADPQPQTPKSSSNLVAPNGVEAAPLAGEPIEALPP